MFHSNFNSKINRPRYTGRHLVMLNPAAHKKTILSKAKDMALNLKCFDDYKENVQDYHKAFK